MAIMGGCRVQVEAKSCRPGTGYFEVAGEALDVLSHLWSRPTLSEVRYWIETSDVRARVSHELSHDREHPLFWCPRSLGEVVGGLIEEYELLFDGPGLVPCPPYELFWHQDGAADIGRFFSPAIPKARKRLYRPLRPVLSGATCDRADHITAEMRTAACACWFDESLPVARAIVGDHLMRFAPRLCRAVMAESGHSFYRNLAATTLEWLDAVSSILGV